MLKVNEKLNLIPPPSSAWLLIGEWLYCKNLTSFLIAVQIGCFAVWGCLVTTESRLSGGNVS